MPECRVRKISLYSIVLSLAFLGASAFTKPSIRCNRLASQRSIKQSGKSLQMANIFDDIRNFLEGIVDGDGGKKESEESEDLGPGTNRVATIPVQEIKPGGLRLFLMFHLIGAQNTPQKGSWKADQPTTEEYILDLRYHDNTAILTVTLHPDQITIDRFGSTPSTAYMMHEGVIIQSVLDELHECAFDESIEEVNRLLLLPEPKDAIEKVRDALAFA
jgi:hypothetical protein